MTCDLALLDAALGDRAALARRLERRRGRRLGRLPAGAGSARATRSPPIPRSARWGPRLFVVDAPRTLVGWGGFKGPPDSDGAVEIGYAIAPAWEGRGVATAAAGALVAEAWATPEVRAVQAHTLSDPGGAASVRVLEKLGFARDGENLDGDVGIVWRFRLDRRAAWQLIPARARAAAAAPGDGQFVVESVVVVPVPEPAPISASSASLAVLIAGESCTSVVRRRACGGGVMRAGRGGDRVEILRAGRQRADERGHLGARRLRRLERVEVADDAAGAGGQAAELGGERGVRLLVGALDRGAQVVRRSSSSRPWRPSRRS